MADAMHTPRKMVGTASFSRISSTAATKAPVQAPVPRQRDHYQNTKAKCSVLADQPSLEVGFSFQRFYSFIPPRILLLEPMEYMPDIQNDKWDRNHISEDGCC